MPPRISIPQALRQGLSQPRTFALRAPFSSTASARELRRDESTTSTLLQLDQSDRDLVRTSRLDATSSAQDLYGSIRAGARARANDQDATTTEVDLSRQNNQEDYLRQMPRRWQPGEVYSPHDISPSEMAKWRSHRKRAQDVVELLGLRPLDLYRNFSVISEFMTPHGRIKRSVDTGLSPVNQRKMAKAIRRAIGLGLHPSVHRHPELMMRATDRISAQSQSENMVRNGR